VEPEHLDIYCHQIHEAGTNNAAIGRLLAIHLVPVLKTGDTGLIEQFDQTLHALLKIGNYTLGSPLETLSFLLETHDIESATAFLELIGTVLTPELSYNQCKHLCHVLSTASRSFTLFRRHFQIRELMQVAETDPGRVDGFLDGMQRGASLLDGPALSRFVAEGIIRFERDKASGHRFLSLESQQARDWVDAHQVAATFSEIQQGLNRYLQARTGRNLSVRPLSELSKMDNVSAETRVVCSQGNRIFLPDEIDTSPSREKNRFLYKCLTRLEACYHEFGTYEFDLEKAMEACLDLSADPCFSEMSGHSPLPFSSIQEISNDGPAYPTESDMTAFCRHFPDPDLAADLLTIYEHGRIRVILVSDYPGIIQQSLPVLIQEANRLYAESISDNPLACLYMNIALNSDRNTFPIFLPQRGRVGVGVKRNAPNDEGVPFLSETQTSASVIDNITAAFSRLIHHTSTVEDCAAFVWATYSRIESLLTSMYCTPCNRLKIPFARYLQPDMMLNPILEAKAARLKQKLAEKGFPVYKTDIRKLLADHAGNISRDDLLELLRKSRINKAAQAADSMDAVSMDFSDADFSDIPGLLDVCTDYEDVPASWYPEWDSHQGDYLHRHVRVVDRIPSEGTTDFYERTLDTHRERVSQIRYAFELMKPQGMKILRNWIEGDEPDYRAVLDFVLDKKAGLIPSDRLYIKRLKHERNVAVLLLVDLSRSTGNTLDNDLSGPTVLDIEKEAMVMFCEALGILGDTFAIAGFSGTGRLSVDYTHIKEFDETLDDAVRRRIGSLTPQRNTRMGAAIRHATTLFETVPASVRLMVILGDGFPNDVDYKREYAIADTRKAIGEALSRGIHTHAVTVNMQYDARLDDLYGNVHHNVISDVRELPAKLVRIYGSLTRSRPDAY
jgi:hypothetical protein